MAHIHSVYDTDPHFMIDPNTRLLKNVSETQTILIQNDHNSERFTFELPRYIDGHDMSLCNIVEVHYINISSGSSRESSAGVYEVTDLQVSPASADVVICSWLLSGSSTKYAGNLNFLLRFACSTDRKIEYVWNTAVLPGVTVSNGLYNSDILIEEYTDVLLKWESGIHDAFDAMLVAINGESAGSTGSERVHYSFTVGTAGEQEFIEETNGSVFSESGGYRYHDRESYTIYRFPLSADGRDSTRITSAVFRAHTAQQTHLSFSTDKQRWVWFVDTCGLNISSQYYHDLAKYADVAAGAEYLYVRIADSSTEDGSGGAILSDVPVTLDLIYGVPNPHNLPCVNEEDDGKILRVIQGKWCAVDGQSATSRVHTYSFIPGEESETKYIHETNCADETSYDGSYRYMDKDNYIIYKYHIPNSGQVKKLYWTAVLKNKVLLEVSNDCENWATVLDQGTTQLAEEKKTLDLTESVNLLAWDDVYIRLANSDPDKTTSSGGAIRANDVELRIERSEVMLAAMAPSALDVSHDDNGNVVVRSSATVSSDASGNVVIL